MDSSGTPFANGFSLIIILLPLAPVLLVFLTRKFDAAPLHFLVLVCLLDLMKGLSERFLRLSSDNQYITTNIVSLLEWVTLIQLFKSGMSMFMRTGLNILLTAFLSSVLTFFFLTGWGRHSALLDSLQAALLIGVIIAGMAPLVRHRLLSIFRVPLFWIAGGTLFYLLLVLLVEWAGPCCLPGTGRPTAENSLLLSIAGLIRYGLYIQAVLVCRPAGVEEEVRDWGT